MAFATKPTVDLPDDYCAPGKPSGERLTELQKARKALEEGAERRKKLQHRKKLPKHQQKFDCPERLHREGTKYTFEEREGYWIAQCPDEKRWIWDELTRDWLKDELFLQSITFDDPNKKSPKATRQKTLFQRAWTYLSWKKDAE